MTHPLEHMQPFEDYPRAAIHPWHGESCPTCREQLSVARALLAEGEREAQQAEAPQETSPRIHADGTPCTCAWSSAAWWLHHWTLHQIPPAQRAGLLAGLAAAEEAFGTAEDPEETGAQRR